MVQEGISHFSSWPLFGYSIATRSLWIYNSGRGYNVPHVLLVCVTSSIRPYLLFQWDFVFQCMCSCLSLFMLGYLHMSYTDVAMNNLAYISTAVTLDFTPDTCLTCQLKKKFLVIVRMNFWSWRLIREQWWEITYRIVVLDEQSDRKSYPCIAFIYADVIFVYPTFHQCCKWKIKWNSELAWRMKMTYVVLFQGVPCVSRSWWGKMQWH